jgi:ribosomal-protein-alanine N-acetyltransferase
MTRSELHQAQRVAAFCTLAKHNDSIVGYQISTQYRDGAHLARLGVDPEWQGQGIGTLLLQNLLSRFYQRQITTVTVNTQASNIRSQRLYRDFGFYRNGYDLPVWSVSLCSQSDERPT